MTDFEHTRDLPLSGEERRRLKGRNPTEPIPTEFAAIAKHTPPVKTVKFIERLAVATRGASAAALAGYAPPWVGVSVAPKRASAPPPPIVMRRGEKLDPFFIHPPDDRRLYNDTTYPWGCVCRITRPDGGGGSGVLIGPRHVLTASHVVEWLAEIRELDQAVFGEDEPPTWRSFAAHLRLVEETELAYPIIRAADGAVMDGMHRVIKALVQGRETVDSVQFETDPAPDYVGRRPDELSYEQPPDERCT